MDDEEIKAIKSLSTAINKSSEILRSIDRGIKGNSKLSKAMLETLATGDTRAAREALIEAERSAAGGRAKGYADDIEFETTTQEQGRVIAEGRPQFGNRGFLQRLLTPQYIRPEREIEYIGYRRALGLGTGGLGGFAERFGNKGYSLGAQIQQATVPNRPPWAAYATEDGRRAIYSGGSEGFANVPEEDVETMRGLFDPKNAEELYRSGFLTPEEYKKAKNVRGRRKGVSLGEDERSPSERAYEELIRTKLGKGKSLTSLGQSKTFSTVAKTLGLQAGEGAGILGKVGGSLFDIGGGMMVGARAIAGPVGIALTAAQMAYEGVDKLYGFNRAGASLGYGFSRNPLDIFNRGSGANVALGRSIQTQMDALFSFGLSAQQTAEARATIEGMGLGGRGNEKAYDSYYRSMTDVMKNTGLGGQELAPFYEQFMRAGGASKNVEDLTKLLRDDLPKAANQSRMSLSQMAQTLQQATQIAMQSPYNVRTPFEVQRDVAVAFEAGAPKGMENIAAGGNMFIAAMAARSRGTSIFQAMQNPEAMNMAAADIMQKTFNIPEGMSFDEYRRTDEGALKVMQVQAMTGLDVSTMSQIYSEGIGDFQAAQGLAEKFAPGSLETIKGHQLKEGMWYKNNQDEWEKYKGKTVDDRSQIIKGSGGLDIYRSRGEDIRSYYEKTGVMKTIEDALMSQGEAGQEEFQSFLDRLDSAKTKQGDVTYRYIKEEAMKAAGDITKAGSGDYEVTLSDEARQFFKINFVPNPKNQTPRNELHGPGQVFVPGQTSILHGKGF